MKAKISEWWARGGTRRAAQGQVDDLAWRTFRGSGRALPILTLFLVFVGYLIALGWAAFGVQLLILGSGSRLNLFIIPAAWLWERAPELIAAVVLFAYAHCLLFLYATTGLRLAKTVLPISRRLSAGTGPRAWSAGESNCPAQAREPRDVPQTEAFHDSCLNAHRQTLPADPAVEAIKFSLRINGGQWFLDLWMHGDYDEIRREWPDAPDAIFIAAKPVGM